MPKELRTHDIENLKTIAAKNPTADVPVPYEFFEELISVYAEHVGVNIELQETIQRLEQENDDLQEQIKTLESDKV